MLGWGRGRGGPDSSGSGYGEVAGYFEKGLSSARLYIRIHFLLNQGFPGSNTAFCITGTESPSRGKTAWAWGWPPKPSTAEVEEKVELWIHSPPGLSWPVLGWREPTSFSKNVSVHALKTNADMESGLLSFLNLVRDGSRFNPRKIIPCSHWIWG